MDNSNDKQDKTDVAAKISEKPTLYVGVGASAGGLEALEEFFSNMPPDTGLAFMVIQHLSPDYKSMMLELLSRRTKMNVYKAEDGMLVEPNCIYLIPPKKNMTIFHAKLYLTEQDHGGGLNLPIDIFFRSLAVDQGKKAVGVVLSGTGSDGTLGIRAIKEVDGMAMVQDYSTAKFDGMPKSAIATGQVDYILPPSKMPEELIKYIKHPYFKKHQKADVAGQQGEDILPKVLGIIRSQLGVDFTYYKPNTIIRRIERRISINQLDGIEDYIDLLGRSKEETAILYKELLIGVTQFFRNPEAYKVLEEDVIPAIFENKEGSDYIRIWSAGCSTGEEAYSIAVLFREYMDKHNIEIDVKVFATDLDKESIESAGIGFYPENIASDVSPERLQRYFTVRSEGYQVNENIRRMVIFANHNIIKDPPFSKIDLVCCRNLLIYFKPVMQRKVLAMFHYSMSQGGYLFLGSSESLNELSDVFIPISSKWKIFKYKEGYKAPLLNELFNPQIRIEKPTPILAAQATHRDKYPLSPPVALYDQLLNNYLPASILVTERNEIIHFFGDVNEFIKLPKGRATWNLMELIRHDMALVVGNLIHKVKKEKKEVRYNNFQLREGDSILFVNIIAQWLRDEKSKTNFIVILFNKKDVTELNQDNQQDFDMTAQVNSRIEELERELQYREENLQTTVEELETSNEELQATNEELVASNEELQSTNEELQSVNEELYTVNSEHQRKIEELTMLNNDMNNLLNNTNIGTMFLDSKLLIRKFTQGITKIVNVLEIDVGRPITHISFNSDYKALYEDVKDVIDQLKAKEVEVQDLEGNWYLLRIQPYRQSDNSVSGVIITLIEITKMKQTVQALAESEYKYKQVVDTINDSIFIVNAETGVISEANHQAEELTGYKLEELVGMHHSNLHPEDKRGEYTKLFTDHIDSPKSFELDLQHKEGHRIPSIVFPRVFKGLAEELNVIGVFKNLEKEKELLAEIEALKAELNKQSLRNNDDSL